MVGVAGRGLFPPVSFSESDLKGHLGAWQGRLVTQERAVLIAPLSIVFLLTVLQNNPSASQSQAATMPGLCTAFTVQGPMLQSGSQTAQCANDSSSGALGTPCLPGVPPGSHRPVPGAHLAGQDVPRALLCRAAWVAVWMASTSNREATRELQTLEGTFPSACTLHSLPPLARKLLLRVNNTSHMSSNLVPSRGTPASQLGLEPLRIGIHPPMTIV